MYDDLLEQARILAKLDVKKPKQANLRRAVSSAYYAVFHFLVHEACCASSQPIHFASITGHTAPRCCPIRRTDEPPGPLMAPAASGVSATAASRR